MEQKRSLFGPLLLIVAGIVWLLIKAGTIPSSNLWALTHIWPFLLIAAGAGLILRSYWRYTTLALDVLIIGGTLLAILFAPQLGWAGPSMLGAFNDDDLFMGPGEPGSGTLKTEQRQVGSFQAIDISFPAHVLVKQGARESLQIEAEDNLLPLLKTEVRNGKLRIFYKRDVEQNVRPTKDVKITIVVNELNDVEFSTAGELILESLKTDKLEVSLSGAGNLQLEDIDVDELQVDLSGAGSMMASGVADSLGMSISGFGDFNGKDLHNKEAHIDISGAGSATVWVDNDLNVGLSGAGSVSYYGSAAVTRQISGVGSVKHLGDR